MRGIFVKKARVSAIHPITKQTCIAWLKNNKVKFSDGVVKKAKEVDYTVIQKK